MMPWEQYSQSQPENKSYGSGDIESIINEEADRAGISRDVAHTIVKVESGGRPEAISSAGAIGLTQVMPNTGIGLGVNPDQLKDPRINARTGFTYFKQQLDNYGGDVKAAAAAYNAGPERYDSVGHDMSRMPEETQNYVKNFEGLGDIKHDPMPWEKYTQYSQETDSTIPEYTGMQPHENAPGVFDRLWQDFARRGGEVKQTTRDYKSGNINALTATIQAVGKGGAGSVADAIGEVVKTATPYTAVGAISKLVSGPSDEKQLSPSDVAGEVYKLYVAPGLGQEVKDKIISVYDWALNSDAGRAAQQAIEGGQRMYQQWKTGHPQDAKTLESVFNIGLLWTPTLRSRTAGPTTLGGLAEKISGYTGGIAKNKIETAKDLVEPTDYIGKKPSTGWGPFQKFETPLSPKEQEMADVVSKITDVKANAPIQTNLNAIIDERERTAAKLNKDLSRYSSNTINTDFATVRLQRVAQDALDEKPIFKSDASIGRLFNDTVSRVDQMMKSTDGSPLAILGVRQDLDKMVEESVGANILAPDAKQTAQAFVAKTLRRELNNIVADSVPDVEVKGALRKQSLLYDAGDIVGEKAKNQANAAIGRGWQNVHTVLSTREMVLAGLATITGTSILGAAHTMAQVFGGLTAAGIATWGVSKIIMSPTGRQVVSKLVKGMDMAIPLTKNTEMRMALKADRVAIIRLLQQTKEQPQKQQHLPAPQTNTLQSRFIR